MVHERDLAAFDPWIAARVASGVADLATFAMGLLQDAAAMRAARHGPGGGAGG